MSQATNIDEVIARLSEITNESKARDARMGYFAALYREVTVAVRQKIQDKNYFEDNERMARFDVIFANRYLDAVDQLRAGRKPTQVWDFAFKVTEEWWPITLQHLLLGINAHIGLDLGIAALQTNGAAGLPGLRGDFDKINALLADLVGTVKKKLATVWPPLRILNSQLGDVQDALINFSMVRARDSAWRFATDLAALPPAEIASAIARRDAEMLAISTAVRYPGAYLEFVTKLIRLGEQGSVADIIAILEAEGIEWSAAVALDKPIRKLPPMPPEPR